MAVRFKLPVANPNPSPRGVVLKNRKIGLCGSHSASLVDAPWDDPSWELWGHSSARSWYGRAMDRYFDLHPPSCWSRGMKKDKYTRWLAKNTVPIYMQDVYPDVPASLRYPKGRILQEFAGARPYFTNHVAWMVALALTEGVSTVGLWGINYGTRSEYMLQRGACEYWIGRLEQAGVRVVLPEQCTLLKEPVGLYGYESHDEATGVLLPAYQIKKWPQGPEPVPVGEKPPDLAVPPPEVVDLIRAEEEESPRPDWALGPLPDKANGDAVGAEG